MKPEWHNGGQSIQLGDSYAGHMIGLDNKTKEREQSGHKSNLTWQSWESINLIYSVCIATLLFVESGAIYVFSSPLLDEMLRNANSTPWVEGSDNCVFESLIAPSVLIGSIFGSLSGALVPCLLGLISSLVAISVVYLLGWSVIGASWFISSPSLFRGLILTGRFISGTASGFVSCSVPVCSYIDCHVTKRCPCNTYYSIFEKAIIIIIIIYCYFQIDGTTTVKTL